MILGHYLKLQDMTPSSKAIQSYLPALGHADQLTVDITVDVTATVPFGQFEPQRHFIALIDLLRFGKMISALVPSAGFSSVCCFAAGRHAGWAIGKAA